MSNPLFEWMGKEFANRLNIIETECRAVLSEWKAEIAEAKSDRVLIIASIKEKMATVKDGEPGKDGRDGIDGKDGTNGIDGKDGAQGEKGDPGEKGEKGDQGDPGIAGERGEKGETGEAGERGPIGEHGLKGDPGIVSAEALAEAYKGVWSEGEYDRGQVVTWGGSLWLSLAKNADKPGEQNDNWKLIVKRGRDGKNGTDGQKGDKGDAGPKGDKGEIGYA